MYNNRYKILNNKKKVTKGGDNSAQGKQISTFTHPSLISLAGTWLSTETTQTSLGAAVPRSATADALLYLGPLELLTASRADPSLYEGGAYAQELQRRGKLLFQWGIQDARDPLKADLAFANAGPYFLS
ncbi:hypothetical protein ccbrp13_03600 [Ktedonobacteria bacterium brp13]|nr:hypothetical protein ccbrp13_03600 [Ktedonobacteria bacterium brp13]